MKRKLSLAKETIRSLTTGELRGAAGGTTATWPYCNSYEYTECEGCSNNCPPGPATVEFSICACYTVGETCEGTCPPASNCECLSEGDSRCQSVITCP